MYFDHFGQGITSSFDRENGFGLSSSNGNAAGSVSVDCAARFTNLTTIPSTYYGTPGNTFVTPKCSLLHQRPQRVVPDRSAAQSRLLHFRSGR